MNDAELRARDRWLGWIHVRARPHHVNDMGLHPESREGTHVLCKKQHCKLWDLPFRKCNIFSEGVLMFIDMSSIYNLLVKLVVSWNWTFVTWSSMYLVTKAKDCKVALDSSYSSHICHQSLSWTRRPEKFVTDSLPFLSTTLPIWFYHLWWTLISIYSLLFGKTCFL